MNKLADLTQAYLSEKEWKYDYDEELGLFHVHISTLEFSWDTVVYPIQDNNTILVLSMLPINIPPQLREGAAKLFSLLNFHIVFGNYDLDLNDGEVRFRTSAIFASSTPTAQDLDPLFLSNYFTMMNHFETIMKFVYAKDDLLERLLDQPCISLADEVDNWLRDVGLKNDDAAAC